MTQGKRLTEKEISKAEGLLREGMPQHDVARRLGVGKTTINRIAQKMDAANASAAEKEPDEQPAAAAAPTPAPEAAPAVDHEPAIVRAYHLLGGVTLSELDAVMPRLREAVITFRRACAEEPSIDVAHIVRPAALGVMA